MWNHFTNFFRRFMGWSSRELPTVTYVETDRPSVLHALVIGIDHYASKLIPELAGATSDAKAMDEYLRLDLRVPAEQIVNLRNEQATRDAILREINELGRRKNIRKGDPILIYFAGHGTTTAAPKEWHAGNQSISLIVPYDADTKLENAEMSKYAIPDRTIGALLHKLAERLGDAETDANITVIFDCCHSGSGTRDISPSLFSDSRRVRGFVSEGVPPAALDKDIWSDVPQCRDVNVAKGFAQAGTKSHILLAACRETESAFEDNNKRGCFTQELLRVLRSESVKPDKVTYRDLMQRIANIPGQTPQCEGHNVDRVLFNARVPSRRRAVYEMDRLEKNGTIVVGAGSINGVVEGTLFSVYPRRDFKLDDTPLATMEAVKIHAFMTELRYTGPSTSHVLSAVDGAFPYFAVQHSMSKAAALHLHVATADESQRCILEAIEKVEKTHQTSGGPTIIVEDDTTLANLSARAVGDNVTYTIHEPSITSLGLSQLCDTTKADPDAIAPVLGAASRFFWHLHHAPKKHELSGRVEIQLVKLKVDEGADLGEDLSPPYIADGSDIGRSGVIEVVADDETPYGILVQNNSLAPLHVWAFYFNCSTLAISEYYTPPAAGRNAEASLPRKCVHTKCDHTKEAIANGATKGELTIGYGAGGGRPYTFFLPDGQKQDVGFIKLFISTELVDLSSIEQRSPLGPHRARDINQKTLAAAIWDTVTLTVVQRAPTPPVQS